MFLFLFCFFLLIIFCRRFSSIFLPCFCFFCFLPTPQKVSLGGRLGVLSEAVALAAVLSAAASPFRKANHMVHGNPDEYNGIVGRSFVSVIIASPANGLGPGTV